MGRRASTKADELRWRQRMKEEADAHAALRTKRFHEMIANHLANLSTEHTPPQERLWREAQFVYAFGVGFTFALKHLAPIEKSLRREVK